LLTLLILTTIFTSKHIYFVKRIGKTYLNHLFYLFILNKLIQTCSNFHYNMLLIIPVILKTSYVNFKLLTNLFTFRLAV